jgi:hypothetical protein
MENEVRQAVTDRKIWMRGLYMLLFFLILGLARTAIAVSALFQFLNVLITGKANELVLRFSNNLSSYIADAYRFLTFNSETLPFPFTDWPDEGVGDDRWLDTNEDAEVAQEHEVAAEDSEVVAEDSEVVDRDSEVAARDSTKDGPSSHANPAQDAENSEDEGSPPKL